MSIGFEVWRRGMKPHYRLRTRQHVGNEVLPTCLLWWVEQGGTRATLQWASPLRALHELRTGR